MVHAFETKHIYLEKFSNQLDCEDGEDRLVDGASDSEGSVEVCVENLWGLLAEAGWSLSDAQVVYKQLGFPLEGTAW